MLSYLDGMKLAIGAPIAMFLLTDVSRTCIRQHTHALAYISICQPIATFLLTDVSRTCIRQHTHASAYVSIRQHTAAFVSIRQHTSAYVSILEAMATFLLPDAPSPRSTTTALPEPQQRATKPRATKQLTQQHYLNHIHSSTNKTSSIPRLTISSFQNTTLNFLSTLNIAAGVSMCTFVLVKQVNCVVKT
jgi:hypothetical protein